MDEMRRSGARKNRRRTSKYVEDFYERRASRSPFLETACQEGRSNELLVLLGSNPHGSYTYSLSTSWSRRALTEY